MALPTGGGLPDPATMAAYQKSLEAVLSKEIPKAVPSLKQLGGRLGRYNAMLREQMEEVIKLNELMGRTRIADQMTGIMEETMSYLDRDAFRVRKAIARVMNEQTVYSKTLEDHEKVDVAELEPAILEVAERSALANEDVLQNPKVRVMLGDARELLRASRSEYDLIISEPSNPYRIGIASLFTTEYYEAARARLRPGGMFVQWIQGYEIDAKTLAEACERMVPFITAGFESAKRTAPSGRARAARVKSSAH